jgi:hypothetical protein
MMTLIRVALATRQNTLLSMPTDMIPNTSRIICRGAPPLINTSWRLTENAGAATGRPIEVMKWQSDVDERPSLTSLTSLTSARDVVLWVIATANEAGCQQKNGWLGAPRWVRESLDGRF